MIKFLVKGQNIETLEHEIIAADQVSFVNIKFAFDNNWKPLHKVVKFVQECNEYFRVLGVDGTSCYLPAELHPGAVKMSLFGYDTAYSETVRATTIVKTLNIRPSGFESDGGTEIPPTPDLYQQLLQQIKAGASGKSAYEIAVESGFIGTEKEWLESLKGADGKDGIDGKNGVDGHNGVDGKDGVDGQNGRDGTDGKDGHEGNKVELRVFNKELQYRWLDWQGRDVSMWTHLFTLADLEGKSAYESAVENGFNGTEKEWLEALVPDLTPYVTRVEAQKLVESKFQTVQSDLNSLENTVNSEIHTVKESVEPVISQAHWHHNLTLLNSLTSAKIEKWDKISDVDVEFQQFRDSTQYDQQIQDDTILNLENRITILESRISSGNNVFTVFSAGSDVFEKYDNSLAFMVNNGTYPLMRFVEQYPDFCSENTDFTLNYSSAVFNWGVSVQSAFCNPVSISPNSKVLLEYLAGASSDGELCFISPDGRLEDTPIADFVFEKVKNNDCKKIHFEWLYSADFITVLIPCSDIPTGNYYIAWSGVSDNTHPKIKSIKILEG